MLTLRKGPKDAELKDGDGAVLLRSCGLSAEASAKAGATQDGEPHSAPFKTSQDKAPHPAKLEEQSRTAAHPILQLHILRTLPFIMPAPDPPHHQPYRRKRHRHEQRGQRF